MAQHDGNPDQREGLGFDAAVEQHVAPLLIANGFTRTEQTACSMKYESGSVLLSLFHDPISCELDLVYALRTNPSEQYDLCNLLDVMLGADHKETTFFQASDQSRVVDCVKTIADHLRRFGQAVLRGDVAAYQRIGASARRKNEALTKQILHNPVRLAAEAAWSKHEFRQARVLYEEIVENLTSLERKRLDYCRRH